MPQGIAPTPPYFNRFSYQDRESSVSNRLRLSTWLHRSALDEQIARGVDPESDERLELRAEQLVSREERDRLARAVERTLEIAGHAAEAHSTRTGAVVSSRVPLRVAGVRDCAEDLNALVSRLRGEELIDAQGVAMTRRLLTSAAGPLYYRRSPVTLRHAVRSARLALEPVSTPVEVEVELALAA